MIKNIFLDRDGVINEIVIRGTVISSPRNIEEFKIKDDFRIFCSLIKSFSCNLFIVSNQPDVSRSLLSPGVLDQIDTQIQELISIKEIKYCIHDNADNCSCRKPKPGMILDLLSKYNLKKEESCIIGDSSKDMEAGMAAGITTIFLETEYNQFSQVKSDYRTHSLQDIFRLNFITFAPQST
jgi:D-glycero-D-manno-heptose 1,7-bisphosphate phosphatase